MHWPQPDPRSPFHVTGPAVLSVSGGRTSAFMLYRVLEAHGGVLPPDVVAVFANTGREMPATLDFVQQCETTWSCRIVWLEYRRDPATGRTYAEVVSHNSASRLGEPFRAMLAIKNMLPNPVARFCTSELKVATIKRWVQAELGWKHWRNYVGLRADELHRVHRLAHRNVAEKQPWRSASVLAKARVTKVDHVLPFWKAQPFDLRLAGPWEGNCDGCFLKSLAAKRRMIADHPARLRQWMLDETERVAAGTLSPDAAFYRKDVPSYAALFEEVRRNPRLPLDPDPIGDGMDPFSSCDGCGV